MDLGDLKNITALATQGRQDSQEFVTAFTLSTAQDGILFSQVKGPDGSIWVSGEVTVDDSTGANETCWLLKLYIVAIAFLAEESSLVISRSSAASPTLMGC